jgi:hypothetical protein
MRPERRPQQIGRFDDQGIDVDLARLQRLLAGECEQAMGQIGAPRRGFVDHFCQGRELRRRRDAFSENFGIPGDDGENVVQVVSDASGQLADCLHLLGLAQLQIDGVLFVQQDIFFSSTSNLMCSRVACSASARAAVATAPARTLAKPVRKLMSCWS